MSMRKFWGGPLRASALTIAAVLVTVAIAGLALTDLPKRFGMALPLLQEGDDREEHDHAAHGSDDHEEHDHEGHSDGDTIQLSEQARANLGLTVQPVSVGRFTEYMEVPAAVVEWPGRTHLAITSPLTGVINSIHISRGELIKSGTRLFDLRLTHQDLVNTQQQFLTALGQLDVEKREIARLTKIADSGAIAGKTLLEREYERDRLLASIRAARQAMLLHGLTEEKISRIEQTRELVREVTIYAPTIHADRSLHHDSLQESASSRAATGGERIASMAQPPSTHPDHVDADFLVTQLETQRGQSVEAGQQLGQLSAFRRGS